MCIMCENIGRILTGQQLKDESNGMIPDNAVITCLSCCFQELFDLQREFVVTCEFTFIEDANGLAQVKHILKDIGYKCPNCGQLQESIFNACLNPEMLNFTVGKIEFQNCGIKKYNISVTKCSKCEDK